MSAEELDALAEARLSTPSLGGLLLYDQLVEEGILMLRDGGFLAAWRYRGPDLASATHAEMATLSARLGSLLKLGSGWAVHVDAFRHPAPGYPERGAFPDAVTKVIDDERREQFLAEGAHFETETVLALTYLPPKEREERLWGYLFEGRKRGAPALAARALEQFRSQIRAFEEVLGALLPIERLGIEPRMRELAPPPVPGAIADGSALTAAPTVTLAPPEFDSLLQYLRRCITGRDHPFRRPEIPVYLSDVLGAYPFVGGLEPELDREPIAVIAIEGFPKASQPGMLAALDALALEYRWSTRASSCSTRPGKWTPTWRSTCGHCPERPERRSYTSRITTSTSSICSSSPRQCANSLSRNTTACAADKPWVRSNKALNSCAFIFFPCAPPNCD